MTTNMGTAIVMTPSLDTITTMRTILTMTMTMTMTMSSIMIMGTATAMKPRMDMIMTTTMGRGSLMENVRHSGRTRLATKGRALA